MKMRKHKRALYARLMLAIQYQALLQELEEAVEILLQSLKNNDAAEEQKS